MRCVKFVLKNTGRLLLTRITVVMKPSAFHEPLTLGSVYILETAGAIDIFETEGAQTEGEIATRRAQYAGPSPAEIIPFQ